MGFFRSRGNPGGLALQGHCCRLWASVRPRLERGCPLLGYVGTRSRCTESRCNVTMQTVTMRAVLVPNRLWNLCISPFEPVSWSHAGYFWHPSAAPRESMMPVGVPGGHNFSAITSGSFHNCGLTTDGMAWCWSPPWAPFQMDYPLEPQLVSSTHTFVSIDCGAERTCGLKPDGSAWCWGA